MSEFCPSCLGRSKTLPYACAWGYERFPDLNAFFGNFHILPHIWNVSNFYKLCVKAELNLCNHLWLRQSITIFLLSTSINELLYASRIFLGVSSRSLRVTNSIFDTFYIWAVLPGPKTNYLLNWNNSSTSKVPFNIFFQIIPKLPTIYGMPK